MRLATKKLYQPVVPIRFTVETLAVARFAVIVGSLATNMPGGMKNILATLCSNPIVTKAIIGNQMPRILPATSSALIAIHTARQTSQLQPTPLRNAVVGSRPHLVLATVAAHPAHGIALKNPHL